MTKILERYPVIILLLVCLVIFFCNLNELYVNIMEARNFVTAREMLTENNWLLTTLNGLPRYEKPPLPTWLTALSATVFGMKSLFALRLPAALAATLMVWMMYRLNLKVHQNKRSGLFAGLILATSFYVIFSGRNGQWDIFTHAFMLTSIYFLYTLFEEEKQMWKNALLAGIFAGASFLSKGPVSLYTLFLPFLIAYGVAYKYRNFTKKILPAILFIAVMIVSGLWWFVYVRIADPETFVAIASEEATNWGSYNIRPFYYYWSFFTQSGIWTIPAFVGLLYPYLKNRVSDKKAYLFSLLWTISSVVLLSVIPEKKSRYLLPVLLPLAMNTAFYIEYLVRTFASLKNKKETFPVYFNFGLIALIGVSFPVAGYIFFRKELQGLWLPFILASIFLFGIGVLMFRHLAKKNIQHVFLLTIAFIMSIILFGFPLENTFSNDNTAFNNIDRLAAQAARENINIYSFGEQAPEMIWEYKKIAPRLDAKSPVRVPEENSFGVLVTLSEETEFKRIFATDFNIRLKETFDINYTAGKEERNYRERLVSRYYILNKKP
ncbi:ArnT family glycosyltransferase [Sinomicrobium weinanense]|uniref:Glycosyltransferase family 39 protein n=1 Tax=Sinomicrobium weinanense TaxID=2842200 RepID=A0A926Q2J7_9FLAO|nr:glycosyltransferase family 39 protein [Sinomicrobium weinanense]MBC9796598.1 glycosyltransferase family 39 protein [Sinomicrobium weinanense]MBU3123582.1 glycosyltransferase family 39 protein [Sinomicrobium weinanense]